MASNDDLIGHLEDPELGQVMVLREPHLPTMTTEMAVRWLTDRGIPGLFPGTITLARRRNELPVTPIGRNFLYSEYDLLAWVQSRYGVDHFAKRREAVRAHFDAKRDADTSE